MTDRRAEANDDRDHEELLRHYRRRHSRVVGFDAKSVEQLRKMHDVRHAPPFYPSHRKDER